MSKLHFVLPNVCWDGQLHDVQTVETSDFTLHFSVFQVMDMLLDSLAAKSSGTILIDNYTNCGLMIFDGNTLWFIAGLYSGTDGKAYCNRRIEFCIDPALPSDEKFTAMFVNKNGSRVALSSAHSVFLIEIPYDCWCRQSVTRNPLTDHLLSNYHCKSRFVGCRTRSPSTAIDILKIRWCSKERHESGHHAHNRLAVLYSGNIVRIYDTDITCATPAVVIDFKSLLGPSESSCGRSFGVYNYIASFDFGPSFVCVSNENGAEISLKTLFAIDNDCGDIYIVVYSEDRVVEMQGPLALTETAPGDSACSGAFDVLYIQYHEKTSLPFFSIISSKGCITHFLVLTLNQETFDGHMEFVLVSYDNILLPYKPVADISYCLQNDSVQSGKYFVLCGANLFSIDINPWAHLLSDLLLANANYRKSANDLPNSEIHHVFLVLGSIEGKGLDDTITFGITAITADDKSLISHHICKAFGEKSIVYIAVTSSKQLLYKFTRQNTIWHDKRVAVKRSDMSVESGSQNYLLEECLKILQSQTVVPSFRLNKSVTEAEAMTVANSIVEILVGNMKVTQVAFKRIQDIITEDIKRLEAINNNKSACMERLLRVLSTYVDLRNNIYKIQRTVAQLKKQSDELGSGLVPKMFPLTDPEKNLKDKLETIRVKVDCITRQLPHLANEVATKRRDRFGPVRSFCASMSAQKFMLSKNTEDINEMVSWTKQLIKRIDSIQASIVAKETLSNSSKLRS
ncbi:Protein npp-24 [Dirofilaria immitis]